MGVAGLIFEPHYPNFENQYSFWRCSNDAKMIFWFLYWFQIFKDQCGVFRDLANIKWITELTEPRLCSLSLSVFGPNTNKNSCIIFYRNPFQSSFRTLKKCTSELANFELPNKDSTTPFDIDTTNTLDSSILRELTWAKPSLKIGTANGYKIWK